MTKILSLAICRSDASFSKSLASTSSPPCPPPKKNCSTQILGLHPKPPSAFRRANQNLGSECRPNPRAAAFPNSSLFPKSSEPACKLRGFGGDAAARSAARLRQPCGGEGSEGRALAIPRASGAGWAGAWVARPSRRDRPPPNHPRADGMGLTSELLRRRARLHQHEAQPSPPKPQPRVAAGPANRVAESQISSDSICVVDGAVESLEPNPPLSTMLCYRRAKPTVEKTTPISRLQGAE